MRLDLILAAIIAAVPWISMDSSTEAVRITLLAGIAAMAAFAGRSRLFDGRVIHAAVGLTMLVLGWLQSFPAFSHSGDVGTYIASGAAMLSLASFRAGAARRSQLSEA